MALNSKVAIVTGAAMGIGKAITEILLQNGAKVALLDINETAGKNLNKALRQQYGPERTLFLTCDIESEEQTKAFFQKTAETFGGIDILCNNAGILNEVSWEQQVSVNLLGVVRGTFMALEHMNKLNGGRGGDIVNIASISGVILQPTCPVYTASKYGVVGFTRAMAVASKVSGYGIRVNTLCPGLVQTELTSNVEPRLGKFSHLVNGFKEIGDKFGVLSCSEVAESFLELVTDEAKNGEALVVTPKVKKYVTCPDLSQ